MKALVTGGAGFLGRYVVEQLLKEGHRARCFARGDYPELKNLGVECHQGDILEKEKIKKACQGVDVVFHTAAKVGLFGNAKEFYQTNVIGTQNVIDACHSEGVKKLVFTSSSSVTYSGKNKINADESDLYPKKFLSAYSQTKALAEQKILEENDPKHLLTVALRPHLIFGPRDRYIIPGILEKSRKGYLRIIGDGKNLTDITYVENAARAHLMAATHLAPSSAIGGKAYYITQGKPVNLWNWINELLREMNIPQIKRHISFNIAYLVGAFCEHFYRFFASQSEPPLTRMMVLQLATSHTYSIVNAQRDFGYVPLISTEEGLKRTIAYFKQTQRN